jgi:hypothetical protein
MTTGCFYITNDRNPQHKKNKERIKKRDENCLHRVKKDSG